MADLISMLAAVAGSGGGADPNFNQTVLLLHGDGTNGAQNNTFLDSSTNNFTITRNGNTTQGTFSPFSLAAGEWSNYFGGGSTTERRLTTTQTAIGTGNFTVAFWVYLAGTTGNDQQFFDTGTGGFTIAVNSSTQLYLFNRSTSSAIISASSATAISLNTWVHVAVVRSGTGSGQVALYINGSSVGTGTASTNFTSTTISIGGRFAVDAGTWYTTFGYISNVLYADSALSITVPTTPYTNQSGTKLLTCQSNRFVDNSSGALTITRNGDVRVTPFSPFAPTAAYSAGTNGGSGYFDGTGDYLNNIGTTADWAFLHNSTATFTIQCWIFWTGTSFSSYPVICSTNNGSSTLIGCEFYVDNVGKPSLYITRGVSGAVVFVGAATTAIKANEWTHLAVTYDQSLASANAKFYLNGVADGTGNKTANAPSNSNSSYALSVGARYAGGAPWVGYISNLRITNVIDNISLPTTPLTAISGTSLLCNFTNAGIFDNTGKNNLETVGNAQIDTTTKKFGTGSLEFDGTGDWLAANGGENFAFGSGAFTIEFWYYSNNINTQQILYDQRPASTNGVYPTIYKTTGNKIIFYVDGADRITGTTSIAASTWYHIAVAKSGTSTKLFINGTQEGSTYTDSNSYLNPAGRPLVGGDGFNVSSAVNGFLDDVRITKGVARYTAAFTPPTAAFPNE